MFALDVLVSALVNDASAVVTAVKDAELEEPTASAVVLLALVAGQDVEPAEGSDGRDGRWRIACKVDEDLGEFRGLPGSEQGDGQQLVTPERR